MSQKKEPWIPDASYHFFNRANGSEVLFRTQDNYEYFLKKFEEYLSPLADVYCYCLMPNHFHFLIRVKSEKDLSGFKNLSGFISQQISNFLNAYAKAYNKMFNRRGSLFMRPFKRKRVYEVKYLKKLIHYIHYNPVKANLCANSELWPYSSYKLILAEESTFLLRNEVLTYFGDRENFIHCHQRADGHTGINA